MYVNLYSNKQKTLLDNNGMDELQAMKYAN